MGININFLNGQGLNTLLSLLYNRISGKADTPNANNMASASTAGYMSAVDFNKINAQAISANTDLDNITDDGWYCCASDATAATLSHCPTTVAFYMEVHKHTTAGKYQYIVEYLPTGAKHYSRNFFGSWGNWVEWELTDTTYSAGSGISISNGEISNSAPNVQADWNASGTAAEILNKPTIPNYSNATTSAAGLMSATDKSKLNAINAGTQVSLMSGAIDLVSASNNRTALSSAVSNFRAIEIRYAMYTGASTYTGIVRAVNRDGQGTYGNIAALVVRADTAGSLSLYMCNLQLSGSNLTLSDVNNVPSFYVFDVLGYK